LRIFFVTACLGCVLQINCTDAGGREREGERERERCGRGWLIPSFLSLSLGRSLHLNIR
jgi:hypothetical protein